VRITLPSGTPAELAQPEGDTSMGLVIIPDIFGLRPLFDDMAARLASEQRWTVCAVEPFPGQEDLDIEGRFDAIPALDDERVMGDVVAAAQATGHERVGVLGFCMGGMYTLKAAATRRFDRAAAFYGMIRIPPAWRGEHQGEPLFELARGSACPVLAIVGGKDPYTPAEDVAALRAVNDRITIVEYPDAEHGFVHDPERPAHRPEDAADAWARALSFLSA
jgi:carboxymethylenebutenolidase